VGRATSSIAHRYELQARTSGGKLTKEFNIDKYNPKNKKDCTE